jgi:hypothetical protein
MDHATAGGVPQFATADYAAAPELPPCKACGRPLIGDFYRVNGVMACGGCVQAIRAARSAGLDAPFLRALLFGAGAALLGFALYVAFALATGLVIGFVSLAVGFLVGKAMLRGAGGIGGRRHQITAALLTYAAVSLSAIPIELYHAASVPAVLSPARLGIWGLIGLASPFLALADPLHGLIGLVILFVGVRIAWRLTAARPLNIEGPLRQPGPCGADGAGAAAAGADSGSGTAPAPAI